MFFTFQFVVFPAVAAVFRRKEPSLSALCLVRLFLKAGWSFCNGSPFALQRQPFQPPKAALLHCNGSPFSG